MASPAASPQVAPLTYAPSTPALKHVETSDSRNLHAGSALAVELSAPGGDAARDVEVLHSLLRQYLRQLHSRQGLPIGDDIDLGRVLTGHNPMKRTYIPPGHSALTGDGHLRDRWGTPYFIHPRGNNSFEIRSAGPDRRLFTGDDIIANPLPQPGSE